MIQLTECRICQYHYSVMRPHCPTCGARRNFVCSHSYEPYKMEIAAWNELGRCEMVRAYSHTICVDEDSIMKGDYDVDEA